MSLSDLTAAKLKLILKTSEGFPTQHESSKARRLRPRFEHQQARIRFSASALAFGSHHSPSSLRPSLRLQQRPMVDSRWCSVSVSSRSPGFTACAVHLSSRVGNAQVRSTYTSRPFTRCSIHCRWSDSSR